MSIRFFFKNAKSWAATAVHCLFEKALSDWEETQGALKSSAKILAPALTPFFFESQLARGCTARRVGPNLRVLILFPTDRGLLSSYRGIYQGVPIQRIFKVTAFKLISTYRHT